MLRYAARHGYEELCDEAAPHTIDSDARDLHLVLLMRTQALRPLVLTTYLTH